MTSLVVEEKKITYTKCNFENTGKYQKKRYRVPPWTLVMSNLYPVASIYSEHKNLQLKINIEIRNHNKNSVKPPCHLPQTWRLQNTHTSGHLEQLSPPDSMSYSPMWTRTQKGSENN